MIEQLITDKKNFKLKLVIKEIDQPKGYKHFKFINESFNDNGDLINSSSYDYFLSKEEVHQLSQIFLLEAS